MSKQPTLTKADLIEEVLRVTELPRKESESIVETIFDSIIESLQKGDTILAVSGEIGNAACRIRGRGANDLPWFRSLLRRPASVRARSLAMST